MDVRCNPSMGTSNPVVRTLCKAMFQLCVEINREQWLVMLTMMAVALPRLVMLAPQPFTMADW